MGERDISRDIFLFYKCAMHMCVRTKYKITNFRIRITIIYVFVHHIKTTFLFLIL